jgi:hypothetical protein
MEKKNLSKVLKYLSLAPVAGIVLGTVYFKYFCKN